MAHASSAVALGFRGGDPFEALSLARLACQSVPGDSHAGLLAVADQVLATAQRHLAAADGDPFASVPGALVAQALCGTPEAGVPQASA